LYNFDLTGIADILGTVAIIVPMLDAGRSTLDTEYRGSNIEHRESSIGHHRTRR
jgi:hypothetical protein